MFDFNDPQTKARLEELRNAGMPFVDRQAVLAKVKAGEPLAGVTLMGVDLSGADLAGVNLELAIFLRVDLQGANLEGARLMQAKKDGPWTLPTLPSKPLDRRCGQESRRESPVRPQYPSGSESLSFLHPATGRSTIDDRPRRLSESDSYWAEIFRRMLT